jgi:hypothetical protein
MTPKQSLNTATHGKKKLQEDVEKASGKTSEATSGESESESTSRTLGRAQTKLIGGHFDPAISKQLRQLALDQNSTVQKLLAEALNELFIKYGKQPIAQ